MGCAIASLAIPAVCRGDVKSDIDAENRRHVRLIAAIPRESGAWTKYRAQIAKADAAARSGTPAWQVANMRKGAVLQRDRQIWQIRKWVSDENQRHRQHLAIFKARQDNSGKKPWLRPDGTPWRAHY